MDFSLSMTAGEWSWCLFRIITGRHSSVVSSSHNSPEHSWSGFADYSLPARFRSWSRFQPVTTFQSRMMDCVICEFKNLQFVTTGTSVSPQSLIENLMLPFIYRNLPPQISHFTLLLGKTTHLGQASNLPMPQSLHWQHTSGDQALPSMPRTQIEKWPDFQESWASPSPTEIKDNNRIQHLGKRGQAHSEVPGCRFRSAAENLAC